jgi:secretion/DNA translocation related TadE-like protein
VKRRNEAGAGVVIVLVLTAVLVVIAAIAFVLVSVVSAHRRVEAAADLSALGAAGAIGVGRDPCAVAATLARRNGAALETCTVSGRDVSVLVSYELPRFLGGRVLKARARAGPATADHRTLPSTLVTSIRSATRSGFSRGTL